MRSRCDGHGLDDGGEVSQRGRREVVKGTEAGNTGLPEIGRGFTSVVDPEFSREGLRDDH
jgi:hypothetical protein